MGAGSTGGTAPVSPSVMATDMCVVDPAGRGTLELLILWRGSPGWFRKGDGGGSGGGSGAGGSMAGGPSPMIRSAWVSQGGVSLTVRFDPAARKVWIQDKEIALDEANVVLVDGVDSPEGPQVVRTLRIDPEYQTTMALRPGGRDGTRAADAPAGRASSDVHSPIARARGISAVRCVGAGPPAVRTEGLRHVVFVGETAVKKESARQSTVAEYLGALPSEQRRVLTKLRQLIRKHLPKGC